VEHLRFAIYNDKVATKDHPVRATAGHERRWLAGKVVIGMAGALRDHGARRVNARAGHNTFIDGLL
jgi:hypothetical protein